MKTTKTKQLWWRIQQLIIENNQTNNEDGVRNTTVKYAQNKDSILKNMLKKNYVNKHDYDEETLSHTEDDYDADDESS